MSLVSWLVLREHRMMNGLWRKSISLLCAVMLLSVAIVFVYSKYNPTDSHWFPQCPIKQFIGLSCPGCGAQRAVHSLLNGKWDEALSFNYFFVIGIPYATLVSVAYFLHRFKGKEKITNTLEHQALAMIYVYCFFAWFVIRNILDI